MSCGVPLAFGPCEPRIELQEIRITTETGRDALDRGDSLLAFERLAVGTASAAAEKSLNATDWMGGTIDGSAHRWRARTSGSRRIRRIHQSTAYAGPAGRRLETDETDEHLQPSKHPHD